MSIRRCPNFRFDYFLRSLPVESIGKRCEQLMKAAEKEVESLEMKVRESNGFTGEGDRESLPPVEIPKFKVLRAQWRRNAKEEAEKKRQELQSKVDEIEGQMQAVQERLKMLNQYTREEKRNTFSVATTTFPEELLGDLANLVATSGALGIVGIANKFLSLHQGSSSRNKVVAKIEAIATKEKREDEGDTKPIWYIRRSYLNLLDADTIEQLRESRQEKLQKIEDSNERKRKENDPTEVKGAIGPDGNLLEFPPYDGSEEPKPNKKAFTLFCSSIRKQVKSALPPEKRKNKDIVHRILRERWLRLTEEEKDQWQKKEEWDEKRFARDEAIFAKAQSSKAPAKTSDEKKRPRESDEPKVSVHVPKKRKSA